MCSFFRFEDKLNTDLLEILPVLLVSLISFVNDSDRVSVFVKRQSLSDI